MSLPRGSLSSSTLAALCALLTTSEALAQIVQDRDPRRPPALEPTELCEVWRGTNSGNDPSQEVELRLCVDSPGSPTVRGESQYSSLNSGWTRRAFTGTRSADGRSLTLRENRMLEDRPNPGWRFCLIDEYNLTLVEPDRITGGYFSQACDDRGRMTLRLHARVTGAPDAAAQPAPLPPRPALSAPRDDPPRRRRRFLCAAAEPAHGGVSSVLAALCGAAALRRRR